MEREQRQIAKPGSYLDDGEIKKIRFVELEDILNESKVGLDCWS
jgi:hypothetical protein